MIQLEHVNTVVRWYKDSDTAKPYLAICSIFWLSPETAFVYGMKGDVDKAMLVNFFLQLQKLGVKSLAAERKGKMVYKDVDKLLSKALR